VVEARLNASFREPARTVVHDSFVATHVLTDGKSAFAVNDWETIRLGQPEQDVACFLAALRTWMGGSTEHEQAFLDGYTSGRSLQPSARRRVEDWQVYYLMNWAAFCFRHERGEMADALMRSIAEEVGRTE